jgi:hypothetical protein
MGGRRGNGGKICLVQKLRGGRNVTDGSILDRGLFER